MSQELVSNDFVSGETESWTNEYGSIPAMQNALSSMNGLL
jgi:hypothetical protein